MKRRRTRTSLRQHYIIVDLQPARTSRLEALLYQVQTSRLEALLYHVRTSRLEALLYAKMAPWLALVTSFW